MKNLLKIEEFAMFLFSIYLFSLLDFNWWWYLILIITPDIGMLGYVINPKIGAFTYNIFHHKRNCYCALSSWNLHEQRINYVNGNYFIWALFYGSYFWIWIKT